ncbi:MAG TPA: hypothetical protein VFC44_11820, partial [Candidatus Saccharimonadales bacterium]|nr:hypothetical protein [Candidatus Saccharimonadales bacterium]
TDARIAGSGNAKTMGGRGERPFLDFVELFCGGILPDVWQEKPDGREFGIPDPETPAAIGAMGGRYREISLAPASHCFQ